MHSTREQNSKRKRKRREDRERELPNSLVCGPPMFMPTAVTKTHPVNALEASFHVLETLPELFISYN
jgi:hypothetical protein